MPYDRRFRFSLTVTRFFCRANSIADVRFDLFVAKLIEVFLLLFRPDARQIKQNEC